MRVLLTGASGLLGGNILYLLPKEWEIRAVSLRDIDLASGDIAGLMSSFRPSVIIHAAALTAVDRCETDRAEAYALHVEAVKKIAETARSLGSYLIHISTDHVFDGERGGYCEDDAAAPVNYYAETKRLGERAVRESGCDYAVIRTNFFGFNVQNKHDFADWILDALREKKEVRLFTDVIFSPILVNTLADRIVEMAERRQTGIFHIAAHDSCSKYEFGVRLAQAFDLPTDTIIAWSIDDAPGLARRPKNMSLDVSKSEKKFGVTFPTVAESIAKYKVLCQEGYQEKLRSQLPITNFK